MKCKLVLENGREFHGLNFGSNEKKIGEIFFSTSMVGYQDILSDPAYHGKIACMSYPLIGNYGLSDEDYDFKNIFVRGYVVKENNDLPSNFRSTRTLSEAMEENHVTGISDVDTREIVKIIRDEGTMKAMIVDENVSLQECLKELKEYKEENATAEVSCKKIWYSRTTNPQFNVVVLDLGVKTSLVKKLNEYGLNAVVVPYNTPLDQIKKLKPNGIIISNGPANPNELTDVISLAKDIKLPLLGIGLGACVIALSYGNSVSKMKYGHQGGNIPVKNLNTDTIEITTQNQFYSININEGNDLKVTHVNVVDNDVEGFEDKKHRVIGVNYNLENLLNEKENVILRFKNIMKK
ncbi:MAG: glutamine-hydrolyzing carbamoyl-phosphate synthase small subunit [Bacilli bacterium]|nr:glutamine-hydrolyzing carbamoyl-phosphate synthase small subunit [Bacilli bacterium]